jgi:hypothetical protein
MTRRVTITVSDRGDWRGKRRAADPVGHRGNGLAVMRACTAEMCLVRSARGTTVTLVSNDAPTTEPPTADATRCHPGHRPARPRTRCLYEHAAA